MEKSKSDLALAQYEKQPWVKFYPPNVPQEIKVPEKSITQMVDEAAEKWGDRTAVIFYGRKFKHSEIRELSMKFATALNHLGVKKGDIVGLLLPNCPQFITSYFGILRLGAVVTTLSPLYSPREIAHQLKDSGAKTVVCLDLLYEKVEKIWDEVGLKQVIVTSIEECLPSSGRFFGKLSGKALSADIQKREGLLFFRDLIEKYPPTPPKVEINPKKDVAALPYTGGTTGSPKGAMLTHYNIAALQEQIRQYWPEIEDGKEISVAVLPFYHIYGQSVIMLTGAIRGGTGIVFPRPELDAILDAIPKYGVTIFYGVPTLYKYFVDTPKTKRVNWKRLKYLYCGADTLHRETRDNWMRVTEKEIYEGYGLTETTAVSHGNPAGKNRPGSLGVPIPGTHAAVARMDTIEFLPPGETGELVISGPQIMSGYWNRPEDNKKSFFEAGGRVWFRTGDIVKMDNDGYFFFVERAKDLIKYKGLQVYAHEIEELLYQHPKIKEAAVIGVPDPEVGERVKAIVVPEADYRGKLTEEEVCKWCEEKLAPYKVPKIIEFRGEVPKTDVMKVDHKKLREELFRLSEK